MRTTRRRALPKSCSALSRTFAAYVDLCVRACTTCGHQISLDVLRIRTGGKRQTTPKTCGSGPKIAASTTKRDQLQNQIDESQVVIAELRDRKDKCESLHRDLKFWTMVLAKDEEVAKLMSEIEALKAGLAEKDKGVAEATDLHKKGHNETVEEATSRGVAFQLLGMAKNQLNKFYNPTLCVAP